MVFSSLLFVFFFLPLCMLVYISVDGLKKKNYVLILFSLLFYMWTTPKYLILLIGMTAWNYLFARIIDNHFDSWIAKPALIIDCGGSLLLLGYFKYTGFFCGITNHMFGVPKVIPEIVLPIGISFYTFQLISYVVDVYWGDVRATKRFSTLLLYSSMFTQCIAGPIVRYKDVAREIYRRKTSTKEVAEGVNRFAVGLAKKTILANTCAQLVDKLMPESTLSETAVAALWLGALFYMFQIYFDFSAYSDMAIGMGLMMGFHFKENFDYPYISGSVSEFWRRWHISLGTFFRDYVYIPLGGSRCSLPRIIWNLFVVWALTGLWHGASWNFVCWGLYYFIFLMIERIFFQGKLEQRGGIGIHIYTLIVIYFGWILFKWTDASMLMTVGKGMLGLNQNALWSFETGTILLNHIFFILLCILAVTPVFKIIHTKLGQMMGKKELLGPIYQGFEIIYPAGLVILSMMALVGNSYNPFMYFQF